MPDSGPLIQSAKKVIEIELEAISALTSRIDTIFAEACKSILACEGRVIVSGMGKSGHIAKKIAATLASTGTPSFFVHPGEASHGDLGMITSKDIVIGISNSGNTAELITILPLIKRLGVPLIAMAGDATSALAKSADFFLDISVKKEACPLGLAPTSSTTATLVMGDALAIALLEAKGFSAEDFAFSHPGGSLGRRLLLKVADIMHSGIATPSVHESSTLAEALLEMTQKGLGMTAVINNDKQVTGIFTDGDLRRALKEEINIHNTLIKNIMTANCRTISADILAAEALSIMDSKKINGLLVVDNDNRLQGALNMHDLLKAGVI
jgi:arabinose-5-phosphate isomerase